MENIQYLDQPRFAEALGVGVVESRDPGSCMADVQRAFFLARSELRPILLNVPTAVFQGAAHGIDDYLTSKTLLGRTRSATPDPAAVCEVAGRLRAAKQPLILVGRGALTEGTANLIRKLARACGALTVATLPAYGWTGREDGDCGLGGFFASPQMRALLSSTDCVLALGTTLQAFAVDGDPYSGAFVVLVDRILAPNYTTAPQIDVHVQGDVAAFATMLIEELRSHRPETWRTADTIALARDASTPRVTPIKIRDGRLDPRRVVRSIDTAFPPDRVSVTGAGHFWNFVVRHMAAPRRLRLVTHGFGAIGHGLPTAIGAMLASASLPGLVFEGDSGLLMNIQELDTLSRLNLPLLVVVMNNGALGSEYYKLLSEGRDPADSVMNDVDFAAIARGFGIRSSTVAHDPAEIAPLIAAFLSDRSPMLLDIKTSLDVVDENYQWW